MKNPNLRLKNKFALAEGKKISELEDRSSEIIQFETGKKNKRRKKNYQKFRDMQDTINNNNTNVMGVPEAKRVKG